MKQVTYTGLIVIGMLSFILAATVILWLVSGRAEIFIQP